MAVAVEIDHLSAYRLCQSFGEHHRIVAAAEPYHVAAQRLGNEYLRAPVAEQIAGPHVSGQVWRLVWDQRFHENGRNVRGGWSGRRRRPGKLAGRAGVGLGPDRDQ